MSEELRTVPISGRIPEEDYNFLMEHAANGTVTASEKLRFVVNFYRRYHEGMTQYPKAVAELSRLLDDYKLQSKSAENLEGMHSELMDRLHALLPELMAVLTSAKLSNKKGEARKKLIETEERACQLTLMLVESVLRMALTRQSPTYNPNLLHKRVHPLFELTELARQTSQTETNKAS